MRSWAMDQVQNYMPALVCVGHRSMRLEREGTIVLVVICVCVCVCVLAAFWPAVFAFTHLISLAFKT